MRIILLIVFAWCSVKFSLYSQEESSSKATQTKNNDSQGSLLKGNGQSTEQQDKNPSKMSQTKNVENSSFPQDNNTEQASQKEEDKNPSKMAQTKNTDSDDKRDDAADKKTDNTNNDKNDKEDDKDSEKKSSKSPHKLTATVAFLSDYRSRGISQAFHHPAVQGELKYTHASGFYFKSWGSNVDGTGRFINNTSLEWDLFLGFTHQLFTSSAEYDIGFLYYYYPGGRAQVPANTSYNTLEYYISVSYKGLEIKLSQTVTDFYGNNSSNPPENWDKIRPSRPNGHSYGSPYLEVNLNVDLCPKWEATFHIGYQKVTHYPQLNYLDWLVNLTREFEWFEVTLSYVATNARKAFYKVPDNSFRPRRKYLGGPGIVVGINRSF